MTHVRTLAAKWMFLRLTKYHAIKLHPVLNYVSRHILGERKYISTHS